MKANPAILTLVTSAVLGSPGWAQIPAGGEGIGGIYAGSDPSADGEQSVVLDIVVSEIERGRKLRMDGRTGVIPLLTGASGALADVAGSFTISGTPYRTDIRILFRHDRHPTPTVNGDGLAR